MVRSDEVYGADVTTNDFITYKVMQGQHLYYIDNVRYEIFSSYTDFSQDAFMHTFFDFIQCGLSNPQIIDEQFCVKRTDNTRLLTKGSSVNFTVKNMWNYLYLVDSTGNYSDPQYYNKSSCVEIGLYYMTAGGSWGYVKGNSNSKMLSSDEPEAMSFYVEIDSIPEDAYQLCFSVKSDIKTAYGYGSDVYDSLQNSSYCVERYGGGSFMTVEVNKGLPVEDDEVEEPEEDTILGWLDSLFTGIKNLPGNISKALKSSFDFLSSSISNLGNVFNTVGDGIKSTFSSIGSNITNGLTNLGNFILDGLVGLFVPSSDYFESYFEQLRIFFEEKLGFLYTPVDVLIRLLTALEQADPEDAALVFPKLEWEGYTVIERTEISFSDISRTLDIQKHIYFISDAILVGAVFNLFQIKLREIIEG